MTLKEFVTAIDEALGEAAVYLEGVNVTALPAPVRTAIDHMLRRVQRVAGRCPGAAELAAMVGVNPRFGTSPRCTARSSCL